MKVKKCNGSDDNPNGQLSDGVAIRSGGNPIGWPLDRSVTRSVVSDELRFDVSFCSLVFAIAWVHIFIPTFIYLL